MPPMPAPTQQTVPCTGAQHVESAGRPPPAPNTASALKLLMDMENHSGANRPGSLSLPSLNSLDHPGPSIAGSASANPVNTGVIPDIVCLSDDD